MQTNPAIRLWTRALAALRVGARAAARTPLTRLAAASHSRVDYWLALAHAAESPFTAIDCLERVLSVDPTNETALAGITWNRWLLTRSSQALPEQTVSAATETSSPAAAPDPSGPSDEDVPMEPVQPVGERASSVLQKIEELEAALETDLTPPRSIFTDEPGLDPLTRDLNAAQQLASQALAEDAANAVPCSASELPPPAAPEPTPEAKPDTPPMVALAVEALPSDLPASAPEPAFATQSPETADAETPDAALPGAEPVLIAPHDGASTGMAEAAPTPIDATVEPPVAEAVTASDASDLAGELPLEETGETAAPAVPSHLPPITEQELATAEWQRWVTGATALTSPEAPANPEAARIVNEVSERLAHALQRVLKQRGLTPGPTDHPVPADPTAEEGSEVTSETAPPAESATPARMELRVAPIFPANDHPVAAPVSGQQTTILVVDDSPTIRRVVVDSLTAHGYRVCEAADGVEGIREIATQRPDLILLDITMPRLDGYRLCRLVKSHATTRHIPVVMLSGKDGTFDRLRGRLAGSSDYITKPFDTPALLQKIEHFLSKSRKTATAGHSAVGNRQ